MNTPINTGGPAFPRPPACPSNSTGMTLRDYFAGQALAGLVSTVGTRTHESYLARTAYKIADAMIAAREVKATA